MQRTKQGDRGVSPVIGVVLMVAITVVLAAGIASIALNTGNDVTETGEAAYDWSPDDHELEINKLGEDSKLVVDNGSTEVTYESLAIKALDSDAGADGNTIADGSGPYELFIEKDGERTFVEELED